MFGYVTPLYDELKVKENSFYKSVYCGLCRTMGKRVGCRSRLTLSYDMVFLALLRFALTGEKIGFAKKRCGLKKQAVIEPNGTLEYCASAGALLAYHNIRDNANDKKGLKKAASRVLLLFCEKMRKKAALPELEAEITENLIELSEIEKSGERNPDRAADCFGKLLSAVFGYGLDGKGQRIANEIGFRVGRWIYILDAADDFEKDRKNREYNPFDEIDVTSVRCSLRHELAEAGNALGLMDYADPGIRNIIENTVYLGMPEKVDRILSKYTGCKDGKTGKDTDKI